MPTEVARLLIIATSLCVAALTRPAEAQSNDAQHSLKTDADKIANAMSAAPPAISHDAAIIDMSEDRMRILRDGKNDFTCIPDDPSSPGNDPKCFDRNAWKWLQAMVDHKDPPKAKLGLVYELQGSSDASNDDPFAIEPPTGAKWVTTGPHIGIVGMAGMLGDLTHSAADPAKPFIMWSGTPYEHIVMLVK